VRLLPDSRYLRIMGKKVERTMALASPATPSLVVTRTVLIRGAMTPSVAVTINCCDQRSRGAIVAVQGGMLLGITCSGRMSVMVAVRVTLPVLATPWYKSILTLASMDGNDVLCYCYRGVKTLNDIQENQVYLHAISISALHGYFNAMGTWQEIYWPKGFT